MSLSAQIILRIFASETVASDLANTVRTTSVSRNVAFTDGTASGQAEITWSDSRTVAALTIDPLDLSGLTDDRGTVAFDSIKAIYVRNTGSVALSVASDVVGSPDDWTGGPIQVAYVAAYEVPPGGIWLATNPTSSGWLVGGGGSNQWIGINNESASTVASYDIVLIGEGAFVS